mmetsp:Transcript_86644/g.150859  ORF Transcript_86644/g.150859 Transcript_86644/m.150859 type:complete len:90 (-) Transcript_86644:1160-1429(-)
MGTESTNLHVPLVPAGLATPSPPPANGRISPSQWIGPQIPDDSLGGETPNQKIKAVSTKDETRPYLVGISTMEEDALYAMQHGGQLGHM